MDITRIIALRRLLRPLSLGLLLLVCGCARYNFVGHWVGNRNLTDSHGNTSPGLYTLGKIEITIKDNGQFDIFEAGLPKSGYVRYKDGKAYLSIKTALGRSIEDMGPSAEKMNKEIELTPVNKNEISYWDPAGFDKKAVVLQREVKP